MIRPFGEGALLVEVASSDAAQRLAASLRGEPPDGVTAAVPGLTSVLVEADEPDEALAAELEQRLAGLGEAPLRGRLHAIPVTYDGPDLHEVADLSGLSADEVVRAHAAAELRVLFLGFAPGFAYLGGLPPELHVPRLAKPRTTTPAGSVAIAGPMSGIYPASLPGGWRVIGHTDVKLFDPRADPPTLFAPGDRVRFEPR